MDRRTFLVTAAAACASPALPVKIAAEPAAHVVWGDIHYPAMSDREIAKWLNYAYNYGMGPTKMRKYLNVRSSSMVNPSREAESEEGARSAVRRQTPSRYTGRELLPKWGRDLARGEVPERVSQKKNDTGQGWGQPSASNLAREQDFERWVRLCLGEGA